MPWRLFHAQVPALRAWDSTEQILALPPLSTSVGFERVFFSDISVQITAGS